MSQYNRNAMMHSEQACLARQNLDQTHLAHVLEHVIVITVIVMLSQTLHLCRAVFSYQRALQKMLTMQLLLTCGIALRLLLHTQTPSGMDALTGTDCRLDAFD